MRLCQSTVEQGATLSEQAVDIHVVEGLDFVARWYYSPLDTDMMIWFDSHGIVTRFQLNSGGQIVDWNCLEGLQTGLIVELETLTTEALSVDAAETIQFDAEVTLAEPPGSGLAPHELDSGNVLRAGRSVLNEGILPLEICSSLIFFDIFC